MMSDSTVKLWPPPPFAISDKTRLEDWKEWQRSYRWYANAANLHQRSHDVQLSTFKSLVGPDALEIYNTFSILDTVDVESVMRKFDEHFKPKWNLTLERYKFYRLSQKSGQDFDDFLAEVVSQVDKCEFESIKDEIILYKIVGGIENEELRKALLAKEKLQYEEAVQICRLSSREHFMSNVENLDRRPSRKSRRFEKSGILVEPASELRTNEIERNSAIRMIRKFQSEGPSTGKLPSENISNLEDGGCGGKLKESESPSEDRSLEDDSDEAGDPSRTHQTVRGFPCGVCGKVLSRKRALREHAMTHAPKEEFICHHCGRNFRLKQYLLRHMARAHPGIIGAVRNVYTCDVCNYTTIVRPNMRRHKFQHTDDKPFACQLCNYKCIVRQLMKAHMAKHTGERPFICDVCHKGFTESGILKKHMVKHMSPEEKQRYLAVQTKRSMDVPVDTNTCETCGKGFCSKSALKAHSLIHSQEKPFACNACDYRTAHRSALMTHKNTKHSADKPYICSVCGYACKLKSALQCHMNIHSGERPYVCNLCGSKFKQSSHLSVHMRTHTGEKPFVCDICGHPWATQSNLRQHMKIHQNTSGDRNQHSPLRKQRKKRKTPSPPREPPASNAIPQWTDQVATVNAIECVPVLETPVRFQPYASLQENLGPADCRFYEQRHWTAQSPNVQNPINPCPVAKETQRSTQPNSSLSTKSDVTTT